MPKKTPFIDTSKLNQIDAYTYPEYDRINNPPVGMAQYDTVASPEAKYEYDPHIDPSLQWAGKKEGTSITVPTSSIHIHESINPDKIIRSVQTMGEDFVDPQGNLFESDVDRAKKRSKEIESYKHRNAWANRLIAGDSLVIMNSMLEKEGMAGQVQMVYIDPPYGIKYGSNFQPFVNKRDVKDKKDDDLNTEPEMIKAFRDTWELGIHSYLTYLRDRLLLARELLSDTGSVFVQISDENVHHVREICDEVFGSNNFSNIIYFRTTGGFATKGLSRIGDFLVWYAKDLDKMKYHQLYDAKPQFDSAYKYVELPSGERRVLTENEKNDITTIPKGSKIYRVDNIQSQGASKEPTPLEFEGKIYNPNSGSHWKAQYPEGMNNLIKKNRVTLFGTSLAYIRYIDDNPVTPKNNAWTDTGFAGFATDKKYVVETNKEVIQRCLLMTTDPGDLVLDITCGSGTTAYVAEQWGRRWVTCDTSRIAITLAKKRLMTATFDYYKIRSFDSSNHEHHEPTRTEKNNDNVREVSVVRGENTSDTSSINSSNYEHHEPTRTEKNNEDVREVSVVRGEYHGENYSCPSNGFVYKTVPHITLKSIANNEPPEQETLYDQPEIEKKKIRISGPFTVEALPAPVVKPLENIDDTPAPFFYENAAKKQSDWMQELRATGILGRGGEKIQFTRVEALEGTKFLQGIAETKENESRHAVICFAGETSPLDIRMVSQALTEAEKIRPKPSYIIFAAFQFDPNASNYIDETKWPGLTLLKVQMNTDLMTADLKKKSSGSQSFWLIGQPDVELIKIDKGDDKGKYQVKVNGFDYYDVKKGIVESGGTEKIAMWMLDTDYDGMSIEPKQVFFPMEGKNEGWDKLAKTLKAEINQDLIEKYHGTESLPFTVKDNTYIAVKIVDDRGIESLKIIPIGGANV